jgi:Phage late-transcription coactivator
MKVNGLISPIEFLKKIDEFAISKNIPYIDAVIEYCEKNGIEVETAAAIIKKSSSSIKEKIKIEGEDLNILEKTDRLPL